MPSGVYQREEREAPLPVSFDALALRVRSVSESRRAARDRVLGGRPALKQSLLQLAEVAEALAGRDAV